MAAKYALFDPFLSEALADEMVRLCERVGTYRMYVQDQPQQGIGRGLLQRHDAALHFLRTGGRSGRAVTLENLAARANTFRETYAYDRPRVEGIEPFLWNERFVDAARRLYDAREIVPNIVYANLILPGQELGLHTDVPEFRGVSRVHEPEWLLVVMHHSGLFERWRKRIATGVSWYHHCQGGEFVFYPEGPAGPDVSLPARHNTAILLDTDSVFHGVDLVGSRDADLPSLQPGAELAYQGDGTWTVSSGGQVLRRYPWSELRFSISWKAYCYADERERRTAEEHEGDLTSPEVIERLTAELRARGRIGAKAPEDSELALLLMEEYVRFPPTRI
jgi:hypothetical protein